MTAALLLALVPAAPVAATPAPITMADLRARQAKRIAPLLLNEALLPKVRTADIGQLWRPTPTYEARYTLWPTAEDDGFCTMAVHGFTLTPALTPGVYTIPDEAPVTVENARVASFLALPAAGKRAGAGSCAKATGYVFAVDGIVPHQKRLYRLARDLIRRARSRTPLAVRFTCAPGDAPECRSPRAAFGALPLDLLGTISATGIRKEVEQVGPGVQSVRYLPIGPGEPFSVELGFGPSRNGRSWRVRWEQPATGLPAVIELVHSTVIYH